MIRLYLSVSVWELWGAIELVPFEWRLGLSTGQEIGLSPPARLVNLSIGPLRFTLTREPA